MFRYSPIPQTGNLRFERSAKRSKVGECIVLTSFVLLTSEGESCLELDDTRVRFGNDSALSIEFGGGLTKIGSKRIEG
jgi:hypothetical protein